MNEALNVRLAALPDNTITYVGHEYTKSNVAFSAHVDPTNERIQDLVKFTQDNEVTTGKFTIGDEKAMNVFMRLCSDAVRGSNFLFVVLFVFIVVEVLTGARFRQPKQEQRLTLKRWRN